ncbi:MAG TPA: biopolymer transporter ExbD [Kofleriaceae bacterium]|jgi:biopolymer transport protein ExbD
MDWSAQRVRAKSRQAVRRREDSVEDDERESGELNLIPYLDIITNVTLFLLATLTAGLFLVQIDTTLPDRAPPSTQAQATNPAQNPDDQPLKLVLSITRDHVILWSISGLEGTLKDPKQTFARTGREGDTCDGPYMCESNSCDATTQKCIASRDDSTPVFDYRAINNALFEIANRRYNGKQRKQETYQAILQADGSIPYATIVSVMAAMRCKLPAIGEEVKACMLPSDGLKGGTDVVSKDGKYYDTTRANYDPKRMALFHDILFSSGFE